MGRVSCAFHPCGRGNDLEDRASGILALRSPIDQGARWISCQDEKMLGDFEKKLRDSFVNSI